MLTEKEIRELDSDELLRYMNEREEVFVAFIAQRITAERDENEAVEHLNRAKTEIRRRLLSKPEESPSKEGAKAIFDRFRESERAIWGLVGVKKWLPRAGFYIEEGKWSMNADEVKWVGADEELHEACIYKSDVWEGEHYTIVFAYFDGQDKDAYVFDNQMRQESLEEE